jgi:hypothetical protein
MRERRTAEEEAFFLVCLECGWDIGEMEGYTTVLRIEFFKQSAQVFFFLPHSDAMVDAASCLFPIFMLMLRFQVPSNRAVEGTFESYWALTA